MTSIKRIGVVLTSLIIILSITMIASNVYMIQSFGKLDQAEFLTDELRVRLDEINLPIRVILNISQQDLSQHDKHDHMKTVFDTNIELLLTNANKALEHIGVVCRNLEDSAVFFVSKKGANNLSQKLSHISDHLNSITLRAEAIQREGELSDSEGISIIQENYIDLLDDFAQYDSEYFIYSRASRDNLFVFFNIILVLLILVLFGMILLVFRLISTDMKLVERAYRLIGLHDYDVNKVVTKPIFIEEKKIQDTVKKLFNDQKVINEFKEMVSKAYVIDDIIDHLLVTVHEKMGVDRVGIAFYDEVNNKLTTEYGVATYEDMRIEVGYTSDLNKSDLRKIIETREGYINNNLEASLAKNPDSLSMQMIVREGIRSNMSLPLMIKNNVFGVVFFSSKKANHFSEENYRFASSLLYEITGALNRSYLMKIFIIRITNTIARLVDKKDIETGDHIQRMVKYSTVIAGFLKELARDTHPMSRQMILAIERNAALHDIGKVGTPDYILKKPGRLTPEEFAIMKEHATVGGDIFKQLNEELSQFDLAYYTIAENIARYHHEKWNGKGYPEGISEYDIPIEARVVAVADVFDALSSERVYKVALSFDESVSYIKSQAGKHFDPVVVEAFLLALDEIRKIYNFYHNM